jgi:hypothetical protein
MRGLISTLVLSRLGKRVLLLERGPGLGGADGSFRTQGGTAFEFGMHVLDYMRTWEATDLFSHVVDHEVNRVTLERGIILRGQAMPYAPLPEAMPESLRALLPGPALRDELAADLPSRERLAPYYGAAFADFIYDEVLPSYPTECRHLAFGVDESRLMANIYPWLFPRAELEAGIGDSSRRFHDKLRTGESQDLLYPNAGYFGAFAEGFRAKFDPSRVEVVTNSGDVEFDVGDAHQVRGVTFQGRSVEADHYFWAGPWPALCGHLDIPCQDPATDRVLLGSFVFDKPPQSDYHELLVGDPTLHINRVYFPAHFRCNDEALMQVEFAYPIAEQNAWPEDPDEWKARWLEQCRGLGLITPEHAVVEFDFKSVRMHYNGFGMEGEALIDADPSLLDPQSNVEPVIPSMANLNLNTYVPEVLACVTNAIGKDAADARALQQIFSDSLRAPSGQR